MTERQKRILSLMSEGGQINVSDLSDQFGVSGVTIRQDLDALQSEGLLRRVHGGAVLPSAEDIAHRLGINFEKKHAIAERAAAFVESGDTIFIEAGSTNALLARQLANRRDIRVVTNNVFIARTLKDSEVTVILLGGVYQHESECVVGQLAKLGTEQLNFAKTFIGLDGLTFDAGLTCSDMMRAEIAGTAVQKAGRVFVLTDSPKFGRVALSRICNLDEVDHIVTDAEIPGEYRERLPEYGVELLVVGESKP